MSLRSSSVCLLMHIHALISLLAFFLFITRTRSSCRLRCGIRFSLSFIFSKLALALSTKNSPSLMNGSQHTLRNSGFEVLLRSWNVLEVFSRRHLKACKYLLALVGN